MKDAPLIIQSDGTMLLDVHHKDAEACRADLIRFAELVKSPEHVHTYKVDAVSLWNAVALGVKSDEMIASLDRWSKYPVPESVSFFIRETAGRWGKSVLEEAGPVCRLTISDEAIYQAVLNDKPTMKLLTPFEDRSFLLEKANRGQIKLRMISLGFPVDDRMPLIPGPHVDMALKKSLSVRDYQEDAARALLGDGRSGSGYGVIVLPCGSGKTIVGMDIMARLSTRTLILTTNTAAVHQWMDEIRDKMDIDPALLGEYTGQKKEIKPVTVSTYQVLTWRPDQKGPFPHMAVLSEGGWGLVIYDEVHMLPAPVFQVTSTLQAVHRVGLTATLVREDGREGEVFSLVGPKRYDSPWDEIARKGYIAQAFCHEIRIRLPKDLEIPYAVAPRRTKYRIAGENPAKVGVVKELVAAHPDDFILVIGEYLDQLKIISEALGAPLLTGKTPNRMREALYSEFRAGKIRTLVVSKVANFAVDLPDASVAIQVSGTFGSRSEEAQRLGRILRPKDRNSHFYTLVTRFSVEEDFAANRQKFLAGQGYAYDLSVWDGKAEAV